MASHRYVTSLLHAKDVLATDFPFPMHSLHWNWHNAPEVFSSCTSLSYFLYLVTERELLRCRKKISSPQKLQFVQTDKLKFCGSKKILWLNNFVSKTMDFSAIFEKIVSFRFSYFSLFLARGDNHQLMKAQCRNIAKICSHHCFGKIPL